MPPDVNALAASHDVVQILFWFVVALAGSISGSLIWFARYILIPARDEHFAFLAASKENMAAFKLHINAEEVIQNRIAACTESNTKTLERMELKIRCPPVHGTVQPAMTG